MNLKIKVHINIKLSNIEFFFFFIPTHPHPGKNDRDIFFIYNQFVSKMANFKDFGNLFYEDLNSSKKF